MWLVLKKMGCGRSKQHSPKPGAEERELNNSKEKNTGKKKKLKGEKKENKDPQHSGGTPKSLLNKMSPDRLSVPPNREVKEFRGKQNFRVTHSQIAFFEMLDKKIEQGEDYHSEHSDHSIEIFTPDDS